MAKRLTPLRRGWLLLRLRFLRRRLDRRARRSGLRVDPDSFYGAYTRCVFAEMERLIRAL